MPVHSRCPTVTFSQASLHPRLLPQSLVPVEQKCFKREALLRAPLQIESHSCPLVKALENPHMCPFKFVPRVNVHLFPACRSARRAPELPPQSSHQESSAFMLRPRSNNSRWRSNARAVPSHRHLLDVCAASMIERLLSFQCTPKSWWRRSVSWSIIVWSDVGREEPSFVRLAKVRQDCLFHLLIVAVATDDVTRAVRVPRFSQ